MRSYRRPVTAYPPCAKPGKPCRHSISSAFQLFQVFSELFCTLGIRVLPYQRAIFRTCVHSVCLSHVSVFTPTIYFCLHTYNLFFSPISALLSVSVSLYLPPESVSVSVVICLFLCLCLCVSVSLCFCQSVSHSLYLHRAPPAPSLSVSRSRARSVYM